MTASDSGPQTRDGSLPPGTRLNEIYEIEKKIAAGGMGEVYRGHNIHTADPVAIKVVRIDIADADLAMAMFRKEAAALNELFHEAIVRYYLFSLDPVLRRPYLVMEFVTGRSLKDILAERALPFEAVRTLTLRVAAGLAVAHDHGIFHRDVSPDNIVLPGDDPARAKIIDFGIARHVGTSQATLIGQGFAGKYGYVSPEQLGLFGGEVGAQSDIYSLALVLAQAITGVARDMRGNPIEVIEKRRRLPELGDVDARLRPLLEWMLQPDPADRPASMREVEGWLRDERARPTHRPSAEAAERTIVGAPPVPHPMPHAMPTAAPVAAEPAIRPSGAWSAPVEPPRVDPIGGGAAHSAAVLAQGGAAHSARPAAGVAAPVRRGGAGAAIGVGVAVVALIAGGAAWWLTRSGGGSQTPPSTSAGPSSQPPSSGAGGSAGAAPSRPAIETPSGGTAGAVGAGGGAPTSGAATVSGAGAGGATTGDRKGEVETDDAIASLHLPQATPVDIERYLTDYARGNCLFLSPTRIKTGEVETEAYGTSVRPFEVLDGDFKRTFGFPIDILLHMVAPEQCGVVDLLARKRREAGDRPRLELAAMRLGDGASVTGTVSAPAGQTVAVVVVEDDGRVRPILEPTAGGASVPFRTTASRRGSGGDKPQIVLAVASTARLPIFDLRDPMPAAGFVERLEGEARAAAAPLRLQAHYLVVAR